MAVSPTVNSYMMQNQMSQAQPSEQIFRTKFNDAAFATLRAKYPKLASLVITLKVVEADIDKGFCLGAFILRAKEDVKYIPVVMVNGSIASCEMIYDKKDDQILPLLPKVVEHVINNNIETATIMNNKPMVDDTRELFRRLTRPPQSTNAILASNKADISALPNHAKQTISTYLESNPELLAKIAEFYPVEVLAEKLAQTIEETLPKVDYPDVVSIDDLKENTNLLLSKADKEALLRDGFTVRKELPNDVAVFSTEELNAQVEKELNVYELTEDDLTTVKACNVLTPGSSKLHETKACVLSGSTVLTEDGMFSGNAGCNPVYYHNPKGIGYKTSEVAATGVRSATEDDIKSVGAVNVTSFSDSKGETLVVFYPKKAGGYSALTYSIYSEGVKVDKADGMTTINLENNGMVLRFADSVKYGKIDLENTKILPGDSLVLLRKNNRTFPFVRSIDEIVKLIKAFGTQLKVVSDGVAFSVNTKKNSKSFSKKAEVAQHLVSEYGLGRMEVQRVLDTQDVVVLSKTAFLTQPAQMDASSAQHQQVAPVMQQQPAFNPEVMEDFAEMQDPEMMDTGIIASFSGDMDIKENFIDLLPNFLETMTNLGKTILICVSHKEELEDHYGREKYQTFVSNTRRVFKTLGEIVVSMQSYVKMTM